MKNPYFNRNIVALANSGEVDVADIVALENVLSMDGEGWALLAPFGEHPKQRMAMISGQPVHEKYIQIFDEQAIDVVLANEKGTNIFARIKNAVVKRPIYNGHPDIKTYAPETVTDGTEQKANPLGLVAAQRRTSRGMEIRPELAPEGASAVQAGSKYLSGFFLFKKTGKVREGGVIEVRPFALASVGLTAHPNIFGVDALANAKAAHPAATTEKKEEQNMKALLIGWLAAQGVALANTAEDQVVFEAIQKAYTNRGNEVTALANEKINLSGNIGTLTEEKKKLATALDEKTVALGNATTEIGTLKTSVTKERTAWQTALIDLGIHQGKIELAKRDAEITALANATDFKTEADKIAALPVKFKVAALTEKADKSTAALTAESARTQLIALANSYTDIKDFDVAWEKARAAKPELVEAMKATK